MSSVSSIKRAQKESLILREVSQLFLQTSLDDPRLTELSIHRVQLSPDKGVCSLYFYTPLGEERFKELLSVLLSYKPSLRKALASRIQARYTPELVFKFDKQFDKQQRVEELLERVKTEDT